MLFPSGSHRSGEVIRGVSENRDYHASHRRGKRRVRFLQPLVVYCIVAVLSLAGMQSWQYQAHTVGRNSSNSNSDSHRVGYLEADRGYYPVYSSALDLSAVRGRVRIYDSASRKRRVKAPVVVAKVSPPARPSPPPPVTTISGDYSFAELEALWVTEGGNPDDEYIAAQVACAESGGDPDAYSPTDDVGLWQINSSWGSEASTVPSVNARAAVSISDDGTSWSPWTTYTSGIYQSEGPDNC